jgi:hypothetical protein
MIKYLRSVIQGRYHATTAILIPKPEICSNMRDEA